MKIRTFIATGFWLVALIGYVWDMVFTGIGNRIVGLDFDDEEVRNEEV